VTLPFDMPAYPGVGSHLWLARPGFLPPSELPSIEVPPIALPPIGLPPIALPETILSTPLDQILDEARGLLGQVLAEISLPPLPEAVADLLPAGFVVPDRFFYPAGSLYFERLAPGT
jgi:hypothetical protein